MSKPDALVLADNLWMDWFSQPTPEYLQQAAAELRRLHAENETGWKEVERLSKERDRLTLENEALRKDAERYRAIRDDKAGHYGICIWEDDEWAQDMRKRAFVDAAIDAAMKEANHG